MHSLTDSDEDLASVKQMTVRAIVHRDPFQDSTGTDSDHDSDPDPDVGTVAAVDNGADTVVKNGENVTVSDTERPFVVEKVQTCENGDSCSLCVSLNSISVSVDDGSADNGMSIHAG